MWLLAYALKTFLSQTGHIVEIINFRTENQKDIYAVLTKRKGYRYILKNAYSMINYCSLNKKHKLFEKFLEVELKCSKEVTSAKQINEMGFDAIIAGSDQIWNISANDFEWIYFLENISAKKYSYAASCGPVNVESKSKTRIATNLDKFEAISVRDNSTKKFVENNSSKEATVVCDPVMLLDKDAWGTLGEQSLKYRLPNKYIFFYTLSCDKRMKKIVQQMSKELNLPIVLPHNTNQNDLFISAKRVLVSGPKEFLYLIKESSIVVTSSFHAMLFSIIFNKTFYIIDGMKDNRKRDILSYYHLEKQSIDEEIDFKLIHEQSEHSNMDFSAVRNEQYNSGIKFIKERILHENM